MLTSRHTYFTKADLHTNIAQESKNSINSPTFTVKLGECHKKKILVRMQGVFLSLYLTKIFFSFLCQKKTETFTVITKITGQLSVLDKVLFGKI